MTEVDKLMQLLTEAVRQIIILRAKVARLEATKPRHQRYGYRIDGTKDYSQAVTHEEH